MDDRNKQPNDFDLELKLRIKRRRMPLPWVVVAGLLLINLSKFWDVVERFLSRVG